MFDAFAAAKPADLAAVWKLYEDVCAGQEHDRYDPGWTLGIYPAEDDIRGLLESGDLYVGWIDGRPVAAMALVPHEDPEYADVPWPTSCSPDEVAVIHLLAVHPTMRGRHLGELLVREAIRLSREAGKRVIHLDVMPGNLAASRVYLAAGFVFVGTFEIFYEDTGRINFEMYECVL